MMCHDAREQLSALIDDALTDPERQALEVHLAGCAECRRELGQLRETVALLRRLPPVHAPAGFVDRVMVEALRPAWPRRLLDALFRPLRVKLPLEAAAVLLVGVSALYVYQRTPEVRELARQEAREPGVAPPTPSRSPVPPPSTGTPGDSSRPSAVSPDLERAPALPQAAREAEPRAGVGSRPVTPAPSAPPVQENKEKAAPAARPEAAREEKPQTKKEASVERRPDAGDAAGAGAPTGKVAQSPEPAPSRDAPAETTGPPAAAAPAAPPVARDRAGALADAPARAPATEEPARETAAAKSRLAARLTRAVDASGRLTVPARAPAEAALDALLVQIGATRVARRVEGPQGLVLIDVLVPDARYRELIEGLGRIGRWVTEYESGTLPAQVRVEVALTVAP